jgi:hypothetical protein
MVIVNVSGFPSRFAPPLTFSVNIRQSYPRVFTPASRRRRRNHGDGGQHQQHPVERDLLNIIQFKKRKSQPKFLIKCK